MTLDNAPTKGYTLFIRQRCHRAKLMEIISRQEAQAKGLKRYFTGEPCKNGHVAERQTSNSTCMECARFKDKKRNGTPKRKASHTASRNRNIETMRARDRARGKQPERMAANRDWKEKNREQHNAASVEYTRKRLAVDPLYRLTRQLRNRARKALLASRACKSGATFELIGCTSAELRSHLEAQFSEGMSWENYSYRGWHVDHIRPCASFDLTDPEQQKQCFHFSNLQPLWRLENRLKSDHWEAA